MRCSAFILLCAAPLNYIVCNCAKFMQLSIEICPRQDKYFVHVQLFRSQVLYQKLIIFSFFISMTKHNQQCKVFLLKQERICRAQYIFLTIPITRLGGKKLCTNNFILSKKQFILETEGDKINFNSSSKWLMDYVKARLLIHRVRNVANA